MRGLPACCPFSTWMGDSRPHWPFHWVPMELIPSLSSWGRVPPRWGAQERLRRHPSGWQTRLVCGLSSRGCELACLCQCPRHPTVKRYMWATPWKEALHSHKSPSVQLRCWRTRRPPDYGKSPSARSIGGSVDIFKEHSLFNFRSGLPLEFYLTC